jgi:hypothetical protein
VEETAAKSIGDEREERKGSKEWSGNRWMVVRRVRGNEAQGVAAELHLRTDRTLSNDDQCGLVQCSSQQFSALDGIAHIMLG